MNYSQLRLVRQENCGRKCFTSLHYYTGQYKIWTADWV